MSRTPLPVRHSSFAALSAEVRRVDEDRWLASRFAPAGARARLIAIYAVNHEIARTAEVVSTPQLIDMRLAWWREALDEIYAGKPARAHPALVAFAEAAPHAPDHWSEIIAARREQTAFATWPSLDRFIERTARAVMSMALPAAGVAERDLALLAPSLAEAARAWGYVAFARSSSFPARAPGPIEQALAHAEAAVASIKSVVVPASAFPAIGYVALAPGYLRALRRGERDTPLLMRQIRLIGAAAAGRF